MGRFFILFSESTETFSDNFTICQKLTGKTNNKSAETDGSIFHLSETEGIERVFGFTVTCKKTYMSVSI